MTPLYSRILDPVIRERAVLTVKASVAGIEAEFFSLEAKVLDLSVEVPDTEVGGLNVEADVVIRVVAIVI